MRSWLRQIDPREVLPRDDPAAGRVTALAGNLDRLESRVEKSKTHIIDDGDVASLVAVLRVVDAERVTVEGRMAAARREQVSPVAPMPTGS